jgi:molybdenum cofactor biosynthesis enzyme MoaA
MRHDTARGTINLNTNGSLPEAVKILRQAGLDSIRVSLNSCRPEYYAGYYRPRGYGLEDLKRSLQIMKTGGGFASINYLVMPGLTDEAAEFTALCAFIQETGLDLIQMRNLNIDPEWYLRTIGYRPAGDRLGIQPLMARLRDAFPKLRFGYFNPSLDPQTV